MSLFRKAKIYIDDVVCFKNLQFIIYSLLHIINRRIPLFKILFGNNLSRIGSERHLEKYFLSKDNHCFIDVGANVGLWTIFMAKKGFEVHAFEPSPKPILLLRKKAKKYSNIHVYKYALGEKNYVTEFNLHTASGHDSLLKSEEDFIGQIKINVRTIDSFSLQDIGLIKIDTEGYEVPVLLGAKQSILRNKPRLIIEIHSPYKEQMEKVTKILKQLNYRWVMRFKQLKPQPNIIADPIPNS